jgi:hypothetical protein
MISRNWRLSAHNGLVEQNDARLEHKCARQRHALAAARPTIALDGSLNAWIHERIA